MAISFIKKLNLLWTRPVKIENSIDIEASVDVVWSVTVNIEQWPEWVPSVTAARRLDNGPFRLGSVARLKQQAQPESDWTVIKYVAEKTFTWETQRPGLRMAATHLLQEKGSDTLNTLRVEVSGFLAIMFWPVLRFAVRSALLKENRGLKRRCESAGSK